MEAHNARPRAFLRLLPPVKRPRSVEGHMPRKVFLTTLFATLALAAPAGAAPIQIAEDDSVPLKSGNVTPLLTIPISTPIGARFRDNYMYVSGTAGLTIYDVSKPETPTPVGALPLPHFENEDVDMGGNLLLISNDPSEGVGALYVIDVSDPHVPRLITAMPNDYIVTGIPGIFGFDEPLPEGIGHTVSCVKPDCSYAYMAGTSSGIDIVDLRDPANPHRVGRFKPPTTDIASHDVQVDGRGIAWIVGGGGTSGYDVTDPVHPKLIARTDESLKNSGQLGVPGPDPVFGIGGEGQTPLDLIHHNSLRLGDLLHRKVNGDNQPVGTVIAPGGSSGFPTKPFAQQPGKTYPAGGDSPLFGITEEDYNRPTCKGAGSFQTWGKTSAKTSTGAAKLVMLDMYTTELEALVNGRGWAPVTGLCSAHYFDYRDGIVAQGWYEEGTRFLDVRDPTDIKQVGYWVPTKGETWSVVYPPTDPTGSIVYALDFARGIDVLKLDRSDLAPRQAPVRRSWLAGNGTSARTGLTKGSRYGYVCRLAADVATSLI
jgi:hypothetical protein